MRLMQLIYHSRPFDFDAETLDDIMGAARKHNRLRGITGALICRSDLYVQMLEGPRHLLTGTFDRILDDDRHSDVTLVWCADASARLFPGAAIRVDAPHTWMWTREQVVQGAVRDAHAEEFLDIFRWLAEEPRQPPRFPGPVADGRPPAEDAGVSGRDDLAAILR